MHWQKTGQDQQEALSSNVNHKLGGGYLLFFSIWIFLGDLFLQFMIDSYKKVLLIEAASLPIILILAIVF